MSCQRLIMTLTMLISLIFTLGVGVQKADAGACKKMGLSNGCVTTKDVRNNTLKAVDLRDEAGADYSSGDQGVGLTSEVQVVRFVTITAPRSGVVIVNASGYFAYSDAGGIARCSITTDSILDDNHLLTAEGGAGSNYIPFGATRGFTVGSGSTTFNLVCDEYSGSAVIIDTSMTAIYVPTRY